MSLFKKPSRKFRQRTTHHDSDEEPNAERDGNDVKQFNLTTNVSQGLNLISPRDIKVEDVSFSKSKFDEDSSQKPVNAKLLSFHEDEDETEVFKVKKSNYSRRLAKQREREKKQTTSTTRQPEKKPELSEDESSNRSEINQTETSNGNEPTIIVKPLNIPLKSTQPIELNGDDISLCSDDDDDQEHRYNPFKNALQSGIIPDAATIFAVKKQRQMAREMGDFVPLDDTDRYDEEKSRLIRDDENDRSDEEEDGRINFTVNVAALERKKNREAFISAQNQSNENDDELDNWEREQIRKGVGIVSTSQQSELDKGIFGNPIAIPSSNVSVPYIASYETVKHQEKRTNVPTVVKDRTNLTTESIRARLNQRLESLNEVYRAHKRELESYKDEIIETQERIEKLKIEGPDLSKQFTFYQEMRAYVEDLSECMDLKLPKVEILERRMIGLLKARLDKLITRRQQDVKDQAEEYSVLANKAMRGLPVDFMEDKPTHDESKSRRAAEREGRRMRRRKLREGESTGRVAHNDGMSTDEEEADSDISVFVREFENILEEAQNVFSDVVEEFGTLKGVESSFLKWRDHSGVSYRDAYVPLCLPKIFSAFIRIELLSWNPLQSKRSLESMKWHKSLLFYAWNSEIEAWAKMKGDPDTNLIPGIVEKVVLPWLSELVQNCWDPLSSSQTLKLVKILTKLCQESPSIDGGSKRLQEVLKNVVSRFQKSLEDDIFIPLYPKSLLESRTSSVAVFFNRQFWTCVKLLHNILTWHGLLAEAPLQELALGCLLNRYIVLALQSFPPSRSVVEKCKTVVNTFPRAWFSGGKGISQLDMLQRFLLQLISRCKSVEEGESMNWCIKEVILMLNTMGASDKAASLSKEFGL